MSHITIYTKSGCPNCVTAKALLKQHGMEYGELDVEKDPDALARLAPDQRQMPQIFFKGERLGGLAGLREWIKWKAQQ